MTERSRRVSGKLIFAGLFIVLPLCGAIVACTAGDEISYDNAGLGSGDGGDGGDGGETGIPKVIVPSDAPAPLVLDDGGMFGFDAASVFPCPATGLTPDGDELGGCQAATGLGCCLNAAEGNRCYNRIHVELGQQCAGERSTFLTCVGSTNDSVCCWSRTTSGALLTRFRADCDGGVVESCDPKTQTDLLDGGIPCQNGKLCVGAMCHGVEVGACVDNAAQVPCQ